MPQLEFATEKRDLTNTSLLQLSQFDALLIPIGIPFKFDPQRKNILSTLFSTCEKAREAIGTLKNPNDITIGLNTGDLQAYITPYHQWNIDTRQNVELLAFRLGNAVDHIINTEQKEQIKIATTLWAYKFLGDDKLLREQFDVLRKRVFAKRAKIVLCSVQAYEISEWKKCFGGEVLLKK